MKNYRVTFEIIDPDRGLEVRSKVFEAADPGHAFMKCARMFPGCKLVRTLIQRHMRGGGDMWQESEPPPNYRLDAPIMEVENLTQTEMNLGL